MPITGERYAFTKENVDRAPAERGVYALYDGSTLIYYGRAAGDYVTVRSRLQSHHSGREGACTQGAATYRREVTTRPVAREKELLDEYKSANGGRLPRCNEQSA